MADNPNLRGKLGNPNSTLATDSRLDPRLTALMAANDGRLGPDTAPPGEGASYQQCLEYCAAFEDSSAALHPLAWDAMPEFNQVATSIEVISGVDGNEITLHIHRPSNQQGPLPGIVHLHGGGMVMMTAQDPGNVRWRNSLANAGLLVIGVEFRNGGGRLGNHPFPAGLNDCASATQWAFANRERLGISAIVVSGESGGGNLCIATALQAKREGWVEQIGGVYAMCPYISGCYGDPPEELVSLRENDGYLLDCPMMLPLVDVYDPTGDNARNPLAWPMHAQAEDLSGLPPHVISVNELDPLRDEGIRFYRQLLAAGVPTLGRTVHGTPHAGDKSFPDVIAEVYQDTVGSICTFAAAL